MSRKVLLVCGVLSSVTYLMADITGALVWDGYSYIDQTVSELSALGTPSRPIVLPIFMAYNVLTLAFAAGAITFTDRRIRLSALMLASIAALGLLSGLFPIQQRSEHTMDFNGTMHIILTFLTVVSIIMAIATGSRARGTGFRVYSITTIAVTLLSGAVAGYYGGRMVEHLPTPWMGVAERISIFSYMAWVAAFSIVLLQRPEVQLAGGRSADGMLHA